MHTRTRGLMSGISLGFCIALFASAAQAQSASSLSGKVTSSEEGNMEGVLVNAKKEGSAITTTVVSNDKGDYSFPAGRLEPGKYTISIRAAGYDLASPKDVDVAASGATADVKLAKTKRLSAQLTNADWILSAPGDDKLKAFLQDCTSCHTLQRVFSAAHNADEWQNTFKRMGTYSPGSTPLHPQPLLPGPRGERPRVRADIAKAAAEFLEKVSLSNTENEPFEMKTLPRPKGKATKVIITEYDLPRKESQPHDVIVGKDGRVWYSDFGAMYAGYIDQKTGKGKEVAIPVIKPEQPKGSLDIEFDPAGNVWLALMYQAGIAKIDPKTMEVTNYPFPKEWQSASAQASMVSPQNSDVDGKVWTNNQESHSSYRLDVKTAKFENMGEATDASGKKIAGYGMPTDKENNLYLLEFSNTHIGKLDAKTNQAKIWTTPFGRSRPRRGRVDDNNSLWFAESAGNAIAHFDPKTEKIKEWKVTIPYSYPYDVVAAKNGEVWTGSMLTDRVTRLDPKTDDMTNYLLPRSTNIRRVFVEESGPKPILWVGSNHGGSIVRVETLD
jgi:virginiamycin B lyase